MKKRIILFLPVLLLFFGCDVLKKTPPKPIVTKVDIEQPKLVVLISVDQMRYDYLERFRSQFDSGFKRLMDDGAVMENANYKHAITGTAPGHATLSTGCHPSNHGIVGNRFYFPGAEKLTYCVTDTSTQLVGIESDKRINGSSPHYLLKPTLGDWLKNQSPQSKVYSVSFKDRSATLMGGKKADRAFWYNQQGAKMISSSYYSGAFPDWTNYYIGKEMFKTSIERGWHKMKEEEAYSASREDDYPYELGVQKPTFPHTLHTFMPPASNASYEARRGMFLWNSPMGDAYTLEFAKAIIENERLGMDEIQDVLFVGCSVADKLGHQYGPYSQEIQDYYFRLDRYLGNFFAYLDERIGKENYYVALSADHGVLTIPEELVRRGEDAQRITSNEYSIIIDTIENRLKNELGLLHNFIKVANYQGFALDYEEAMAKGMTKDQLQKKLAAAVDTLPFVADVFTTNMLTANTHQKEYLDFFKNNYRDDRGTEMKIRYYENVLVEGGKNGTSHGTVYEYDTHVPVIFMGPQVRPGDYSQKAGVVDIAPTLARMLNVDIPKDIDGKPLDYIFKPAESVD